MLYLGYLHSVVPKATKINAQYEYKPQTGQNKTKIFKITFVNDFEEKFVVFSGQPSIIKD